MTQILPTLRVIWTAFRMQIKQMAVDGFVVIGIIVQPLVLALLAIYLLRDTQGFQAIYVIVGSGLTGLWSGTLFFSAHNIESERWTGCLESIIASPTHLSTVMVGKSMANVVLSIASMLVSYPVAAFLFGFSLNVTAPLLFAVSLLLALLSLISTGMLIAPIMSIRPGSDVWVNALEFPMYVVGGFLFPVSLLPAWTTPLSFALAPYWAARALHATSSGSAPFADVLISWGMMALLSAIYACLAAWLFRIVIRLARKEATLGLQ